MATVTVNLRDSTGTITQRDIAYTPHGNDGTLDATELALIANRLHNRGLIVDSVILRANGETNTADVSYTNAQLHEILGPTRNPTNIRFFGTARAAWAHARVTGSDRVAHDVHFEADGRPGGTNVEQQSLIENAGLPAGRYAEEILAENGENHRGPINSIFSGTRNTSPAGSGVTPVTSTTANTPAPPQHTDLTATVTIPIRTNGGGGGGGGGGFGGGGGGGPGATTGTATPAYHNREITAHYTHEGPTDQMSQANYERLRDALVSAGVPDLNNLENRDPTNRDVDIRSAALSIPGYTGRALTLADVFNHADHESANIQTADATNPSDPNATTPTNPAQMRRTMARLMRELEELEAAIATGQDGQIFTALLVCDRLEKLTVNTKYHSLIETIRTKIKRINELQEQRAGLTRSSTTAASQASNAPRAAAIDTQISNLNQDIAESRNLLQEAQSEREGSGNNARLWLSHEKSMRQGY